MLGRAPASYAPPRPTAGGPGVVDLADDEPPEEVLGTGQLLRRTGVIPDVLSAS